MMDLIYVKIGMQWLRVSKYLDHDLFMAAFTSQAIVTCQHACRQALFDI